MEERRNLELKDFVLLRVEQLSPFPYHRISQQLEQYPNAKVIWAQEEHRNMGAWDYVNDRLNFLLDKVDRAHVEYRGRRTAGSTAVGSMTTHKKEIARYLKEIFEQ